MKFDVLIVGGGPAGLSAAFAAAGGGARVAVFEKSKEIGYPIHTSGGSWISELRRLGIPDRFMSPVQEGHFVSANEMAVFKYQEPDGCILDVRGLYQYLGEEAAAQGAEIFVDSAVVEAVVGDGCLNGLNVRRLGSVELFEAPVIIDASGASSFVARRMGLTTGFERLGVGAEYDLYAPNWPAGRVAFLFGQRVAPSGYAWIFPHQGHRVRVGVGMIRPDSNGDPRKYLEQLLRPDACFGKELQGASRLEYHAGVIPSELYLKRTVANNLLVVGDAGGLVSTLLGEGIRFAVEIGRMAGAVAAEAVTEGRYDDAFLHRFEVRWQRKFKHLFRVGAFINKRLSTYSDVEWDEKVQQLARLDAALLPALLRGEFSVNVLLQLLRQCPGLVSTAVFSVLRGKFKIT